jgi:tRNA (uracil-5-)-methyltransferase TRM9
MIVPRFVSYHFSNTTSEKQSRKAIQKGNPLDQSTAWYLNEFNRRFYETRAQAFSATRNNSWRGWERALDAAGLLGCQDEQGGTKVCRTAIGEMPSSDQLGCSEEMGLGGLDARGFSVLDVACGNLRFEAWMQELLPTIDLRFVAVDSCLGLLPEEFADNIRFEERDIISALLVDGTTPLLPDEKAFDLVVSFGFMHHVPGAEARVALLNELLAATRPGGHVIVSFWRFADDEGLASRAEKSTRAALSDGEMSTLKLDDGDYLLGFGGDSTSLRYCHSFTDRDIDVVLSSVEMPFDLVARFRADGRTNVLNEYVVLMRR